MDPLMIALISIGLATNISCFCFGMALGQRSANKLIKPFDLAQTELEMRCAKPKCKKTKCGKPPS